MENKKNSIKKVKIITVIAAVVLVYVGYELYQINKGGYYKTLLQTELNSHYKDLNRGSFCYVVGNVTFPYIEKGYPIEYLEQRKTLLKDSSLSWKYPDFSRNENLYILHLTLPIYYSLGLLKREPVVGTNNYQYEISDEGKKYQSKYINNFVFCYGHQKILNIIDVTESESMTYEGKKEIRVIYDYELDEIPDWVLDVNLRKLYSYTLDEPEKLTRKELKNRKSRQTLIEKNGTIYIDATFNNYIFFPGISKYLKEE